MNKRLLSIRKGKKRNFRRQVSHKIKRVRSSWRKPRGYHSKVRLNLKNRFPKPKVGYQAPTEVRGLHPSGKEEIYVSNMGDLSHVTDPKTMGIRLSSTLSLKKKGEIIEAAQKKKIHVFNIPQTLQKQEKGAKK